MRHKVSELEGALLDAAVAEAEGLPVSLWCGVPVLEGSGGMSGSNVTTWEPSVSWAQGGPIVERERIDISFSEGWRRGPVNGCEAWPQHYCYGPARMWGPTPLVAAMRSFLTSRFGEEVDLPESSI